MQRKTLLAALITTLSGTACQAHAYSVTVVASRPVEEQVIPRMEAGFAPIFPDICYHLTHYKPAAA
ncbi:hypothetical protein PSZ88_03635, partial [Shigella sonnei]|nr:hypothetical protein [Shigella sonnei]MDD0604908.1 hypothetical protein [Shigella sonnei]